MKDKPTTRENQRAQLSGRVIVDFRDGELVSILPVATSDIEAQALIRQLEQAAAIGDLSGIKDR